MIPSEDAMMIRIRFVRIQHAAALLGVSIAVIFAGAQPTTGAEPLGGLARRGFLGAKLRPATEEVREANKIEGELGVEIEEVLPESAAQDAGLKSGDVILSADGTSVATPAA